MWPNFTGPTSLPDSSKLYPGFITDLRPAFEQSKELTERYVFRYILLFKSIAVMGLDIFTAITMISSDHVRAF